jgi:RNA polymerase sigma factor (sigma-70 family)
MTALATDSGRKTPARLAGAAILACQSDDRLVKLFRSGHERAFDAIVERYRKPLVRYCGRILPESRCEDAVQQAFINAHTALGGSDEPVELKPWLFAITRNAALNMLRQNGWNYEQIPLDFDGVRRPDQVFEQRTELERTVAAVNDLPERQRHALVMREFEGRSYDEIALALGANDGAVRQLLNRARVTLRSAASLLMPPPIVTRAAASLPPSDGRRMAEIFGGIGTAGVAKAGATALVAGSLVVGAVEAPLPIVENHKTTREKATLTPDKPAAAAAATSSAHDTPISVGTSAMHSKGSSAHGPAVAHDRSGRSGSSGHSGPGSSHENEGRESGDDVRERSGSGEDRTRTRERSGSGDSSTSGGDDHSGTSGGGGSDDSIQTSSGSDDVTTTSGTSGESGTSGSGSGSDDLSRTTTSGSTTSGSGESTSGTSGSGTSGSSEPFDD